MKSRSGAIRSKALIAAMPLPLTAIGPEGGVCDEALQESEKTDDARRA